MLVMSRRLHEAILLRIDGAPVVIQVTRIAGDRVRLGIAAPSCIPINRAEVELDLIEQAADQTPLVVRSPEDAETVRTLARTRETLDAIARTSDHGVAARARDLLARLFGGAEGKRHKAHGTSQPALPSAPSAPSAVNALSSPGPARSLETPLRGVGAPVA